MPTLSGKWLFAEYPSEPTDDNVPTGADFEEDVNFTHNGNNYVRFLFQWLENYRYWGCLYFVEADLTDYIFFDWDDSTYYGDYTKPIDFGSTPQNVSQQFYDWFIANAHPYTESDSKPVYKKTMNSGWVKQTAYERVEEGWIQISTSE